MDTEDVSSCKDCGYIGCGCGVESGLRGWDIDLKGREIWAFGEGVAEEAFAGSSNENGLVELLELIEVGQ